MQQEQHTPQTPHRLPSPVFDTPSHEAVQPKGATFLVIALIVSVVFLLAAGGVSYWLLTKPGGTTTITQQPTGDGSENVKSVTFVAPTLDPAYAYRQQNTTTTSTAYYVDTATSCGITTSVAPLTAEVSKPKDAVTKATEAAYLYGFTVTSAADSPAITIKDTDATHDYSFAAILFNQDVNIKGVNFTKQQNVVAYKQFGALVASISYHCKNEVWDAKKAELETIVRAFNVKTER